MADQEEGVPDVDRPTMLIPFRDLNHYYAIKRVVYMAEIVLTVPDDMPLPRLIEKLNSIIAEEYLKWVLFDRCVSEIGLDDADMIAFEGMRSDIWDRKKSLFGL
jgi:hypothetical protein